MGKLYTFYTRLVLIVACLVLITCLNTKHVDFEDPVNTESRPIKYQDKKVFAIEEDGIYVSNDFLGARLSGFEKLNDSSAIVIINPENSPINNSAYYGFKIWSDNPLSYYLTFKYPKGYKHRYIPKLKVDNRWKVMDSTMMFMTDSIVTVKLNISKTPILVAAQEIESSQDVEEWYTDAVFGKESYARLKSFGKSALGKVLPVIDIYRGDENNKDIIVLLTRQHPPEVTGYYAFQEFLKTIIDTSKLSDQFLSKYRVLAFPIINPDGVDLGHWRHNAGGIDTNRDWSQYNQPEIRQLVKFINKELKSNDAKLLLGLDFHSTYDDVFYTNEIRKTTNLPNFIEDWFEALEANIPDYKVNEASSNSTKPVSKGWFLYGHNAVGITYEIGDETPREKIKLVGKASAEQMMKLLINK